MIKEKLSVRVSMDLNEAIKYDMISGEFFIRKKNEILRRIFPKEDGYLIFYKKGVRYKIKANKVAMELVTGEKLGPNKAILHKNLNENDYRLQNLKVIPKSTYNLIKEAYRNLSGYLKITAHSSDVFSYVLSWKEAGKDRRLVVDDFIVVRRMYTKLQLKYAKILNRYCVFE